MESFLLLTALTLADMGTTLYALRNGAHEVNPMLSRCFSKFGVLSTLVAIKSAFLGLMWAVRDATIPEVPFSPLEILCALYVVVVIHNLLEIKKQRDLNSQ